MDTKELEKFCPWARRELIDAVDLRCRRFALDPDGLAANPADSDVVAGRVLSPQEKAQRAKLAECIGARGYDAFRDQMAYTWFNRFAAIRFMEIHGYLPSYVRMFSNSEDGSFRPDSISCAADLDLPGLDKTEILNLMVKGDDEGVFRRVIVAQCNELAECLPEVFGQVDDADALTLPDGLLNSSEHSVLYHMVEDIPEEVWDNVEVLGWMYQFYNAELKNEFFKSKRKASAADIAPATQLFTPEWIVRYMVENSLGRLWMLNHPESRLRERMEYYIEPDADHEDFIHVESPEDITLCDPACGSGHILSYAYELLYAIYEECGYVSREIPELILTKNLSGYEVDPRAAQIASLVLALRAREHDRRFFRRDVRADVHVLESVPLEEGETGLPKKLAEELSHLGEIGSLLTPTDEDMNAIRAELASRAGDLFAAATKDGLEGALEACEALRRRFDVVVANPPYMGSSSFNPFMSGWVKKNYPDVKSDLFSSFIVRIMSFANPHGEVGIMCPFVWMFIGSYEKLRNLLIDEKTLTSLIQLEYSGFAGATVPICTFTFHNSKIDGYQGGYIRLSDFVGANVQAPKALEAIKNPACGWFYRRDASTFHQIPGSPISYWLRDSAIAAFAKGTCLSNLSYLAQGLKCGDSAAFTRSWFEVSKSKTLPSDTQHAGVNRKWHFMLDGGDYRKWYGNQLDVVNWEVDGKDIKSFKDSAGKLRSRVQNERFYHQPGCLTWSALTSGPISIRICETNTICGGAGYYIVPVGDDAQPYILGILNSSIMRYLKTALSPTLNNEVGDLKRLPIFLNEQSLTPINSLVEKCLEETKLDWDSFETSWGFKRHPLV
ncbi:BREX-1 system adenine-specific DNA-methyltransferase PglX [uncultured Parolsenella sp.]|uniref:BREX-1 system adenine-specific DNA-methyltransferase PglX n=1 Tax=uncultured Parolsenella sp. TaxID=2083008 RepID=UPI0028062203|nr:BREX-1 system adenine-specific DNA-methyltransferase PglX [uncultured Parolsenella sp.]